MKEKPRPPRLQKPDLERDKARGGQRGVQIRTALIALGLLAGAGKVMHRAYQIQLQNPEGYERHYREEIEIETRRGTIYDRRGAELAVSVELESYFADPVALRNNNQDPVQVAAQVARVLNVDAKQLERRLTQSRRFGQQSRDRADISTSILGRNEVRMTIGQSRIFGWRDDPTSAGQVVVEKLRLGKATTGFGEKDLRLALVERAPTRERQLKEPHTLVDPAFNPFDRGRE